MSPSPPLTVLYRGPLASCNYGCEYCPFAKRQETAEASVADDAALSRFVAWALGRRAGRLKVFFTPWGEALTHIRYHQAIVALSHGAEVERVAVQTNLSARLDWLGDAKADRVGVWATYHPGWTPIDRFLGQTERLRSFGVRFSVGVVGLPAHREAVTALRAALPGSIYVWINAVKALKYTDEEVRFFEAIDPHFRVNLRPHPSLGRACRAGETVIAVDGAGVARRCHFIAAPIGNLSAADFEQALRPRPCTQASCDCHIGYVHLEHLGLDQVYGAGLLERVPASFSASSISHR